MACPLTSPPPSPPRGSSGQSTRPPPPPPSHTHGRLYTGQSTRPHTHTRPSIHRAVDQAHSPLARARTHTRTVVYGHLTAYTRINALTRTCARKGRCPRCPLRRRREPAGRGQACLASDGGGGGSAAVGDAKVRLRAPGRDRKLEGLRASKRRRKREEGRREGRKE